MRTDSIVKLFIAGLKVVWMPAYLKFRLPPWTEYLATIGISCRCAQSTHLRDDLAGLDASSV